MRVIPQLQFSAKAKSLKNRRPDPFSLQPGETPAKSKAISSEDLRYVLTEVSTSRGSATRPERKLPHPFLRTGPKAGVEPIGAILGVVYKHPKSGDWKLFLQEEYRPCVERWVLSVPGGDINKNETPANAMEREFHEESGGKFKRVSRIYTLKTPMAELPAMTNARLYYGVCIGVPNNKPSNVHQLDHAEVDLIRPHTPGGILVSTLLAPNKLRAFIQRHQSRILKTNGEKGLLVSPQVSMIAALLGDQIKKMIERFGG